MPKTQEINITPSDDEIIAAYELELKRRTAKEVADSELARITLENILYEEFGEVRDGVQVIPADQ